ncbi:MULTISPECIES: SusC/RagA family TonB-linked outer membrane protein [Bacteroides]|jgi:TonB-linked SusC/RagA family outer membrane protein|uniref:TonB-dependent receptor n=2 Tax=Bacteroides TaxID=816 RepID=A0A413K1L7_BACFG|nr:MULTISPECIES: TonB-dependent receptor [Bacteroides]MBM6509478.1 TonB-dependent receptor [Bacteroides fragilis]MBU3042387.1 TonB-dependent receptor [Bacteroides sp. HF-4919]MBY2896682.1 TonB-dependent receptor [Bacteroides fragilis]MCM0222662.1 TonB-dependent receptor [Bacteroides fragilis]MCM0300499.1 TonB-dependent receptor [Bacteroides fragilis]
MNEDRKKRGLANSKLLTAVAITALFIGSGNAVAASTASGSAYEVTEQLQSQAISGVVTDANGEPVIGASVSEKGTTNGTITDINGKFSLNVKPGAVLKVTFVGYKPHEVKATRTMKIILTEDSELLDEVVVVGYGTQKKENLTGAVASVDVNKTLSSRPIADVGRGLQGTTPGLSVVIPSGEIGSDPTMKIRGQIGSINGGSAPLILMDNVEIPSIQMVNPDDIESISVLKDAAASSIYGAKAAFGVVLITTKKGAKQESINVSYSGNFSWQNISKKMEMGGIDALEYSVEAFKRVGGTVAGAFVQITEEGLVKAKEWDQKYGGKLGPNDPYVYGRDWYVDANNRKIGLRTFDPYDYMIKEWTPSMTHNLSVNGKSGRTTYNIGFGYLDQTGLMKPAKDDDFKRYNGSLRISTDINKYVTVRAGAMYSKREKRYAYATSSTTADPWLYLYRWGPNMPMGYDDEGNIIRSPHSEVAQANTASRAYNYINVNVGATVNIMKNWKLDIDYTHAANEYVLKTPGTRYTALNSWGGAVAKNDASGNRIYVNEAGETVAAGTSGAMPAYKLGMTEYTAHGANPDHMYRRSETTNQDTWNISTTYDWKVDKNNAFKFLVGMNRVTYDEEYNWSRKGDLSDITNPQFDLAVGLQEASGGYDWEGQLGFFGRINYALKDRYLLEANLRYDATSKFPDNLQWRWFPSFSAGWRASEEAFMQWMKPAVTSLKFRGSWGIIGDQTVSNSLYIPTMSTGQLNWLDESGNKLVYVSTPSAVASNITWQDIQTVDVGLDARFLDGELGLTVDWYQRDTKNMIVPGAGVTLAFGTGAPKGNFGSLRTRGWEIALDYNHRFSNGLGINAMATLSDAETEITKYSDTRVVSDWYVGKKYGEIWGYQTERLYQKDDFVYNGDQIVTTWALNGKEVAQGTKGAKKVNKLKGDNPVYQDFLQSGNFVFGPGDVKFADLNGDGLIDSGSGTVDDPGDRKVIGNSTPRYEYGFRLGADYKGFDFSVFFQGVGKREVWGNGFLAIAGYNSSDGAMPQAIAGNYWREDRTDAFYPRPYNLAGSNNSLNMVTQSRYLLDMSYLRMKNITIGYSIPADILRKVRMQKARIYMSLENFVTWDNLNGLPIDPEEVQGFSMFNTDNYNSGRTGVGTPTFKSLSVGIQLNF